MTAANTLDAHLEEAEDDMVWGTIPGSTINQVTAGFVFQQFPIQITKPNVRMLYTRTGIGTVTFSAELITITD